MQSATLAYLGASGTSDATGMFLKVVDALRCFLKLFE